MQCKIYLKTLILAGLAVAVSEGSFLLISDPSPSSGSFCGGPVVFTCRGIDISIVQEWRLNNDTVISVYAFDFTHTFPRNVTLMPQAPAVKVQITDASGMVGSTSVNTTSTLSVSDVSILNGSFLHCQDRVLTRSNTKDIVVNSLSSPPPPAPNCTITATSGHRAVNLQWLDGFNSLHVVEDYRVMVTPDPSSCSRNHVSPNVTYNCFGLELGTNYSFSFSALNCGGQEGHVANCWVQTQVPHIPGTPTISVNGVIGIRVAWREVAAPVVSSVCTFDPTISYMVIIEDNTGEIMAEQKVVVSESCLDGLCSTTFPLSGHFCNVGVSAGNIFGSSNTVYAADPPAPEINEVRVIYSGDPSLLNNIEVIWSYNATATPFECFEDVPIITTQDSFGQTQSLSGSNRCNHSISTCWGMFRITVPEERYSLHFGHQDTMQPIQYEILGSSNQLLHYTLTERNGVVFALCSSPDYNIIETCAVQYTRDPSYGNLSAPVMGPINREFHICFLQPIPGVYYHQASVIINSTFSIRLRSITTFTFISKIDGNNTFPNQPSGITLKVYQLVLMGLLWLVSMFLTSAISIGILMKIMNFYESQRSVRDGNLSLQNSPRATPSSYQAVDLTTKSREAANNNSICDDDSVVYDEIPQSMMHFRSTTDTATSKTATSKTAGLAPIQLTVNTAYRQGMYKNVAN